MVPDFIAQKSQKVLISWECSTVQSPVFTEICKKKIQIKKIQWPASLWNHLGHIDSGYLACVHPIPAFSWAQEAHPTSSSAACSFSKSMTSWNKLCGWMYTQCSIHTTQYTIHTDHKQIICMKANQSADQLIDIKNSCQQISLSIIIDYVN